MIVGRIQQGQISLESPLPSAWEGLMVRVEPCSPDDAATDLAGRLAALHAMGPMEFEAGEQELIASALNAVDRLSREQMLQISDQMP